MEKCESEDDHLEECSNCNILPKAMQILRNMLVKNLGGKIPRGAKIKESRFWGAKFLG